MHFRKRHAQEDPEINLIPFIDVLLVIVIFLMLTTTYSKVTELKINLPAANAQASKTRASEIIVLVAADGRYMVNQRMLAGRGIETLAAALSQVAGKSKDTVVIINADAQASHQSVINVMDAARRAGLTQLTFATQGQHDGAATSAP
ncbi:MAG: biopolymer transporter ExbD [Aquabacterium sp.]|uniref:ExbD/TolR family protein n=1 Tax=Aquabacterium sp. TaxID=1872578 RepID=UPI001B716A09|nr:biopolymer transporter ExbD [Aquabacterium sp.]MBP7131272.1 biopolymer transporter ExbD [Aquabacterium sp.]MBP9062412.1 biopolymer transporter ExbD [Aquabacterium sp.]